MSYFKKEFKVGSRPYHTVHLSAIYLFVAVVVVHADAGPGPALEEPPRLEGLANFALVFAIASLSFIIICNDVLKSVHGSLRPR
jgi:hypothetical protein